MSPITHHASRITFHVTNPFPSHRQGSLEPIRTYSNPLYRTYSNSLEPRFFPAPAPCAAKNSPGHPITIHASRFTHHSTTPPPQHTEVSAINIARKNTQRVQFDCLRKTELDFKSKQLTQK